MALAKQIGITASINPTQHAMLDYGVAATFFALAARYRHRNRGASALAFVNGAMVLGMSLMTRYPGGVWPTFSFKTHGQLDAIQAVLAGFGPHLFGFAGTPEAQTFHAQALSELGVIAMTDWNADTMTHEEEQLSLAFSSPGVV
jgi:hypothetical protein